MHTCRFCDFENRDVEIVADHMLLVHRAQTEEWLFAERRYMQFANPLPESELQNVDFSE